MDVVALTGMALIKLRQGALDEALQNSASVYRAVTYLQVQRLCTLGDRLMIMSEDATLEQTEQGWRIAKLAPLQRRGLLPGPAAVPPKPWEFAEKTCRETASSLRGQAGHGGRLD